MGSMKDKERLMPLLDKPSCSSAQGEPKHTGHQGGWSRNKASCSQTRSSYFRAQLSSTVEGGVTC